MRDRGTFNFSGNLEVKKDAPLEARSLVNSYADLVKPETWTDEQGGIWKYDCMLVSCKDRPGKVYQLSPGADYTKESSWILIGDTSELNNKVQEFIDSKGAPNGLASLNESGIIPSAQLPSYVDDVIEVDTFSNLPGTGESGKIYIVQDTNLTYRWSGTGYVEISKSLALGETSSTAYPGDKGKATTDKLNRIPDKLITDTVNVNQSTTEAVLNFTTYRQEAQQVGRNTLTITSATTSQAGVMSSSDKTKLDGLKDQAGITSDINAVQTNLETHINNKSNPHKVTKDQVGLGNVDNTSDKDKPLSDAAKEAINEVKTLITSSGTDLSNHIKDYTNPHRVTAEQVGLGNVNNTSDLDKPISNATQKELDKLDAKIDKINTDQGTDLSAHLRDFSNPHKVTKDQVGLGNVDNTSDANKPISNATQTALNGKFSATEGNTLKQIVNDMPDLVVTGGSLRHNSDSVSLNLIQQNLKNPDDAGSFLLKFNSVTDSTAGIILPSDKSKIDKIITNGDGTKYLADNGQYKTVQGGSADIEAIKKYVDDSITSARSIGYMMQLTEIDASTLDENTWYPVTIAAGARSCIRAEVLVALDSGTKPSWSTHERGFSTRKIWEWAPSTWGINAVSDIKVYLSDFAHTNLDPVRGLDFLGHFDTCFVFVRGGGKYHFYTSHGAQVILHTSTYKPSKASDQSVSPTTTTPKPINALDLKNYGKVIDVPNGSYLTLNVNRVGAEAIDYINNIFGSKDRLKEVIMDIIENHQRYLFHSYVSNSNCVEPNNVYAYYNDAKNEYNLQYNLSYYTTNGPVSKRASFLVTPYDEGYKVEVTDLATSWNNLPDVITEGNEFNIADNNINSSYFWINYRPRSGSTTNAKNIYVGNGQGSGGFGEVHASGFFKESDVRLKSNIVPLNHTLDQICDIPTVEFNMHDKHQIGTIAQDLENNFAEVVNTDSDGMKSVDYCMLGVVAVEGIKLLKQEIEDLKKQVEELKNGR